jgi:hypothetical protein
VLAGAHPRHEASSNNHTAAEHVPKSPTRARLCGSFRRPGARQQRFQAIFARKGFCTTLIDSLADISTANFDDTCKTNVDAMFGRRQPCGICERGTAIINTVSVNACEPSENRNRLCRQGPNKIGRKRLFCHVVVSSSPHYANSCTIVQHGHSFSRLWGRLLRQRRRDQTIGFCQCANVCSMASS